MNWLEQFFASGGWEPLLASLLLVLAAAVIGWLLARIGISLSNRLAKRQQAANLGELINPLRRPALVLIPLLAQLPIAPWLMLPEPLWLLSIHLYRFLLIATIIWLLMNIIRGLRDLVLKRYDISDSDNLKARAMHTQIKVLAKIAMLVSGIFGLAILLMTFDAVRQIGVSLLASAGVVGIIAGFAAQRSLATLFAGIQLAFTQPIRVDDVVVVEGEWGRIEEITLTYVVVKIWDERRLIVPISHFLEKSFQNWTRVSAEVLGTVYLYTDYRVDVEAVRNQLLKILKQSELWDGRVAGLQVTDSSEKTMSLRALMSAADSSKAWNLRCLIREQLIGFLQENYPESLPHLRAELEISSRQTLPGG